jgi:hypothetical protein
MHTNRSDTRQISIQAPPETVLDLVGDARKLPTWAPGFAQTVEADDAYWIVNGELTIDLRVERQLGTVDILRPLLPPTGAYSRVVPNGEGSEYLFTLFFPADTPDEAIAEQMTMVEEELRTIRALCESPRG